MSTEDLRPYEKGDMMTGFMRGKVITTDDPKKEGRIGVLIPKLMPFHDPNIDSPVSKNLAVSKDSIRNEEIFDVMNTSLEETNYVWARPTFPVATQGALEVPEPGTMVWVMAEDSDPNKLFYLPFRPTLNGHVAKFDRILDTESLYETNGKRALIRLIREFSDDTSIYYNQNKREFEIKFKTNTYFNMTENFDEIEQFIEMCIGSGHRFRMDKKNNFIQLESEGGHKLRMVDGSIVNKAFSKKINREEWELVRKANKQKPKKKEKQSYIEIITAGGHSIRMDDEKKAITLLTAGGHKFEISDQATNMKFTAKGGGSTNYNSGGDVLHKSAGGAKVNITGGNVMLN